MSEASDAVRKNFAAGDNIRDAGLSTPESIERFDDILYGPDERWQRLDVYRPRAAALQKLPVIVSVHGGGWVYGDKERYQYYCMDLACRGFAVVNFTYRLAPEYKYPASLEDTNLVFSWVLSHGDAYGFDLEHVFAVGDSAGGHNLGLYAGFCTNPEFAAIYPFDPPEGFVPRAIVLNCGAYLIGSDEVLTDELTMALMKDLLPGQGTPEEFEEISVVAHVTESYPPTFFMTCPNDFLKEQAPILAAKLGEKNVNFVYRFYGNTENPLCHVFQLDIRSDDAKRANDEECAFFRGYM